MTKKKQKSPVGYIILGRKKAPEEWRPMCSDDAEPDFLVIAISCFLKEHIVTVFPTLRCAREKIRRATKHETEQGTDVWEYRTCSLRLEAESEVSDDRD